MRQPMSEIGRKNISRGIKKFWRNKHKLAYSSKGITGVQPRLEKYQATITICKYCKRPF